VAKPATTHATTALALDGKKDKNIIKNFLNRFITFNYTIFYNKCDIIEIINIKEANCEEKGS
jgi:hypothetical protein